ncbi:hypothetical protein [Nocardia sp. NPDC051570]|uniref:hypothetical protein n=1 Tax=Nocardia sp. NPDC051570 TaxID=3364324 RepID=UPI0037A3540F
MHDLRTGEIVEAGDAEVTAFRHGSEDGEVEFGTGVSRSDLAGEVSDDVGVFYLEVADDDGGFGSGGGKNEASSRSTKCPISGIADIARVDVGDPGLFPFAGVTRDVGGDQRARAASLGSAQVADRIEGFDRAVGGQVVSA